GRGRRTAPGDGSVETQGWPGKIPRPDPQRHARARLRRRLLRAHLRADQGFRRLRFSGIARGEFRPARLGLVLGEELLSRGIHLRAAELAADGFLSARAADPGCETARRARAAGPRDDQRLGLWAGAPQVLSPK